MEDKIHCALHSNRPAEYVCPYCNNLPMCESCKQEHIIDQGHQPANCKEIGCKLMRLRMREPEKNQLTKELAKMLRKIVKELEAGLLGEIKKLQSNWELAKGQHEMQKLNREGRYAELYFYAKNLPVDCANNNGALQKLKECLLEKFYAASEEVDKSQSKIIALAMPRIAPQFKPMLATYWRNEVFLIKPDSDIDTKQNVLSALKSTNMSMFKAIFILPWCRIENQVALELASILQMSSVSALYFEGRDISDIGAEALAQTAFHNNSLTMFCIRGENISDAGAEAVAKVARNCPFLYTFYIGGHSISDTGAKTVAKALKDCPLTAFGLWGDKISDSGAIAVTKIISSCNRTLSAFLLSSRDISADGAKKVVDMVRSWPLLSEFYLSGQRLSEETLAYILEAMAGVSCIRSVNLYIGGVASKGQIDYCLARLQFSGVAKQLKLRFQCEDNESMYEKYIADWKEKFAELRIVEYVTLPFIEERVLGEKIPLSEWRCSIF